MESKLQPLIDTLKLQLNCNYTIILDDYGIRWVWISDNLSPVILTTFNDESKLEVYGELLDLTHTLLQGLCDKYDVTFVHHDNRDEDFQP